MSINDINGYPFGRNRYGKSVNLDIWSRENNNMLVVGDTVSGKTTLVKHTIIHQYFRGVAIIVLDIHREYKELCDYLGGYWIDGDSDYVTCPKEVLSSNLVVIDMYDLRDTSDELKESHYTKILAWCWSRMIANPYERVLVVIDDTPSISTGSIPMRVCEIHQRCRLHNSGMLLVSTTSNDYTYRIASNSCYIVLLCSGSRKYGELITLLDCSDDDRGFIARQKKGTALLCTGPTKVQVNLLTLQEVYKL